jgi:hypothetical protein
VLYEYMCLYYIIKKKESVAVVRMRFCLPLSVDGISSAAAMEGWMKHPHADLS